MTRPSSTPAPIPAVQIAAPARRVRVGVGHRDGLRPARHPPRAAGHRHRHHHPGRLGGGGRAVADPGLPMPAPARTGGGSVLPMRDLITLAAGQIHYLAVFENHSARPLYLGRSRRLASPDQRILCHARDRGCTHPDCAEPGYHCEVNHAVDYADGRPDRRRQPVLHLRAVQPGRRRRHLHHPHHRRRPTGLDRRHRPTGNQPTTPPRGTASDHHTRPPRTTHP